MTIEDEAIKIENKWREQAFYYEDKFKESLLEIYRLRNIETMFNDLKNKHTEICYLYEKATWNKCDHNGIEHPSNWSKEEWDKACNGLGRM